jgi:uncharacterized protein YhhL (DUF1145 family)
LSGLFGHLLVDGIGITLAPWCVVGVILILSGPRPLPKAIAFLIGAATTMTVILIACELLIGDLQVTDANTASSWVERVKLVLGLVLLAYGIWRLRRPPAPPTTPRWLTLIDKLSIRTAFAVGLVMPNPVFAAAGAIQIVKADVSAAATVAWLVFFVMVSLSSMITPVVVYARAPETTGARLADWKEWLGLHTGQILTAMCVGYGGLIAAQSALSLR